MRTNHSNGILPTWWRSSTVLARVTALSLWAASNPAVAQSYYTLTDLGVFANTSWASSAAFDLNNFGQVVGASLSTNHCLCFYGAAFLWTPSSPNAPTGILMELGAGVATAINSSGQVLAHGNYGSYLWTPSVPNGTNIGGTGVHLKVPHGADGITALSGINDAGDVVGTAEVVTNCDGYGCETFGFYAARWNNSNGQLNGQLLDSQLQGSASAINNAGQIIGQLGDQGTTLWQKNGGAIPLSGVAPGRINDYGQIAGGALWTPTTPNGAIGQTTVLGGSARGINSSGQVVGTFRTTNNSSHAFLWVPATPHGTDGTLTDLNE